MKLFTYQDRGMVLLIWAFNRGHAAKLVAKHVEKAGQEFVKTCPLKEVPEANEKGSIIEISSFDWE